MTDFQYKQMILMAYSSAESLVKETLSDDDTAQKRVVDAINHRVYELLGRTLHETKLEIEK